MILFSLWKEYLLLAVCLSCGAYLGLRTSASYDTYKDLEEERFVELVNNRETSSKQFLDQCQDPKRVYRLKLSDKCAKWWEESADVTNAQLKLRASKEIGNEHYRGLSKIGVACWGIAMTVLFFGGAIVVVARVLDAHGLISRNRLNLPGGSRPVPPSKHKKNY
ncbi:MAG TPA: hypothetical protein PKX17_05320 [Candidatus Methanomethylicus sp.]|nr:hypothetical protein [Candidatus Methanomethylicus sp.]